MAREKPAEKMPVCASRRQERNAGATTSKVDIRPQLSKTAARKNRNTDKGEAPTSTSHLVAGDISIFRCIRQNRPMQVCRLYSLMNHGPADIPTSSSIQRVSYLDSRHCLPPACLNLHREQHGSASGNSSLPSVVRCSSFHYSVYNPYRKHTRNRHHRIEPADPRGSLPTNRRTVTTTCRHRLPAPAYRFRTLHVLDKLPTSRVSGTKILQDFDGSVEIQACGADLGFSIACGVVACRTQPPLHCMGDSPLGYTCDLILSIHCEIDGPA
jgi:hypothetical protein